MEILKNILIDSLNGFATKDILFLLFQLVLAALLSHITQLIWNNKNSNSKISNYAQYGVLITLLTVFSKYSVSIAILSFAVIFLFKDTLEIKKENGLSLFVLGFIGVGIGSGNIILSIIGLLFILIVSIFGSTKKENA